MLLLYQVEVIIDLVGVEFGGEAVEMQGQFGQVVAVVLQGAIASAGGSEIASPITSNYLGFDEITIMADTGVRKGINNGPV